MSEPTDTTGFVDAYIDAWSTTDATRRTRLVQQVYASDAIFHAAEPGDPPLVCHGVSEIDANISRVNERLVQGHGLTTKRTGFAENHDALRVSWRMLTPDGNVAMTGMNVLLRDAAGRIVRDYIFIG